MRNHAGTETLTFLRCSGTCISLLWFLPEINTLHAIYQGLIMLYQSDLDATIITVVKYVASFMFRCCSTSQITGNLNRGYAQIKYQSQYLVNHCHPCFEVVTSIIKLRVLTTITTIGHQLYYQTANNRSHFH